MTSVPWHFPLVIVAGLVWHGIGAFDYVATQYTLDFWMGLATGDQRVFMQTLPDWADGAWGIAVWAGLIGVIVMAFRVAFAPAILGLSLIAMVVLTVYLTLVSEPPAQAIAGQGALITLLIAVVIALFLWLYARNLHKAGIID